MAVFTVEMRELAKELVRIVSGFDRTEENFKLCFQFAKSNFRFHRFLDVNDLNVSRSIKGLCDKFVIHSQPEKAEALERLAKEFLSSNLERNYPKSDAHYGVLLFLLCLSDSPVNADYTPKPKATSIPQEGEQFDWASYLMEGIEFPTYSDTDSEWSEESEEDQLQDETLVEMNDSAVGEEISDESIHEEESHAESSKSWLLGHVTTPYWDSSNPDYHVPRPSPSTTAHHACNLATDWAVYQQRMEPFYTPANTVTVTESQVVRETLWVLLGAERSFVYCFDQNSVGVRRGIQVSHLTPLALRCQLEHFADSATLLHRLRQFCDSAGGIAIHEPGKVAYTPTQTYEAFADALSLCLEEISHQLQQIEKSIVDKGQFMSLLNLEVQIQPALREVQGLYDVFSRGVLQLHQEGHISSPPAAHMCSGQLLTVLWETLSYHDTMGEAGRGMVKLLFPLWMMVVRPYMAMLEHWMMNGALMDKHSEFCLQRNMELASKPSSYWEECFHLRTPCPKFLQPVVDKIMLAGKSMHLIESIGKLKQVERESVGTSPLTPSSLYEEFLRSLKSELTTHQQKTEVEEEEEEKRPKTSQLPSRKRGTSTLVEGRPPQEDSTELQKVLNFDPLMLQFLSTLHTQPQDSTPEHNPSKVLWRDLQSVAEPSLQAPLTVVIEQCLYPLLHERYLKASGALVRLLMSDYHLTEHFRTVQRFFLMEAGDTMLQFYSNIFQRIQDGQPWQDPSYLNDVLQEVLQNQYPTLERSLSVQVEPSSQQHQQQLKEGTIYSIASISLHYKVPWPLDTIFTSPLMETYNEVFHLLLQVKWAKWSLQELRNRACMVAALPPKTAFKLHLLLLLRARLLHFVNSLNNYLMTRILHSVGLEFQHAVAQAEDLDRIVSLHKDYVSTVFDRCLLNKKASIVKEAIMKVLGVALLFRQRWEQGIARISFVEAEQVETEFSKCSHFLVTCLNQIVKRGSFPHLETLAFSMRSLKSGEKIFTQKTKAKMKELK